MCLKPLSKRSSNEVLLLRFNTPVYTCEKTFAQVLSRKCGMVHCLDSGSSLKVTG